MINLDIKEYCHSCCDFEPDVEKPVKNEVYSSDIGQFVIAQTDTIIHCKHARRCESIKRYLEKQHY